MTRNEFYGGIILIAFFAGLLAFLVLNRPLDCANVHAPQPAKVAYHG